MALFKNKKSKDHVENIVFDKEEVIKEILEDLPIRDVEWKIFLVPALECDLLCIRNVKIQEEINITANPFSNYKRTEPSIYQVVVGAYIVPEFMSDDELKNIKVCADWRILFVDCCDKFYRKLQDLEKNH